MNKLQIFKNDAFEVRATLEDGTVLFDAETVAKSLGITQVKNLTPYVRWERVNEYLGENSPQVGKGDMIPEPMVYKLAFKASNETAEKFQDWLAIEVIPQIRKTGAYMPDASVLSPELKLMNAIVQQMNQDALSRLRLEGEMKETRAEILEIREVVEIKPFENWRDDTNKMINKICRKTGDYQDTRKNIYEALDRRAGTKVNQRLDNMRARAILAGTSRSKADSLGILDVIAEDKKLIEIYTAIVKEMAIKKGVS